MTTSNVFYYKGVQDNIYDKQGARVYESMNDVLTKVDGTKIILETLIDQKIYLDQKSLEKLVEDKLTSAVKLEKRTSTVSVYTN